MAKHIAYEHKLRQQKQWVKTTKQRLSNGIVVMHYYGGEPRKLSWWDDTGFNLNGKRVMIWWTHPRMDFEDSISDMAYKNVPYPDNGESMFNDSEKIYKYIGKSGKRKKLSGFKCNTAPDKRVWYDALKAEEERLRKVTDLIVTPHYKVEIKKWCRGVSICCPIEVRGEADLHILCNLVKRLLKGETTLDKEFPGYKYTKDDWDKEQVPEVPEFHGHTIA